jgi:hypothetical protein
VGTDRLPMHGLTSGMNGRCSRVALGERVRLSSLNGRWALGLVDKWLAVVIVRATFSATAPRFAVQSLGCVRVHSLRVYLPSDFILHQYP